MKITTFNPMILSPKADEAIKLFEELGGQVRSIRMKNADGFHIDIADVKSMPQDMTIIRMNVDDFDEAYDMLEKKGFTHPGGKRAVETESNKSALMTSPSGFAFDLCQHIKDHD